MGKIYKSGVIIVESVLDFQLYIQGVKFTESQRVKFTESGLNINGKI